MKQLGLPLGFMNTSALHVNEDGTFTLNSDGLLLSSDSSNCCSMNSNKRPHKKRGKKKVLHMIRISPRASQGAVHDIDLILSNKYSNFIFIG